MEYVSSNGISTEVLVPDKDISDKKKSSLQCSELWWGGYRCLLGGFLICLSFGSDFSFYNINTYLTSYMRQNGHNDGLRYSDFVYLNTAKTVIQGLAMPFIGALAIRIGSRVSLIIGGAILSGGYMLTYFTVKSFFWFAVVTLGAHGLAFCFVYANVIGVAQSWFSPSKRGLVASVILSGYGFGSSLWAPIETFTVNSHNIEANCIDQRPLHNMSDTNTDTRDSQYYLSHLLQSAVGGIKGDLDRCGRVTNETIRNCDRYFTDPAVLDNVPLMFLILGIIFAVMNIIGVILISDPPAKIKEIENDEQIEDVSNVELNEEKDGNINMTPLQVLKSPKFYQLWIVFVSIFMTNGIVGNYSKVFGLLFINDDHFYALVGIFQNILNGLSRIGWGITYDRFGFRACFNMICIVNTIVITTLPFLQFICSESLAKIMYGLYMCLLYSSFPGIFVILAAEINLLFGPKHYQTNFGLMFTATLVCMVIVILMSTVLFNLLGYVGMFLVAGGFGVLGLFFNNVDIILIRMGFNKQ